MAAKEHHQLEAACIQLERAILLFLDEHDYYSATTLAGAAEEIFGAMVEHSGGTSSFGHLHQRMKESLTPEEQAALREDQTKGRSNPLKAALNSTRNWLKHWNGTDEEMMYLDIEREAFDLLERAVESRLMLLEDLTPLIERFRLYAGERYSKPRLMKMQCPSCSQHEGIPLFWGDPDKDTWGASMRGELILAGCVLDTTEQKTVAEYECLDCGHRW
jgi:hypothetical protein